MFTDNAPSEGVPIADLMNLNILLGKRVRVFSYRSNKWRSALLTRELLGKMFSNDRDVVKIEMV